MSIDNWARKQTLALKKQWATHPYHLFMHKASKQEFFESQAPFYFAVDQFSVLLLQLAQDCLTVEQRVLVIKNIYEEHSPDNLAQAHTHTFLDYLLSLNENESLKTHEQLINYIKLNKNPHITQWMNTIKQSLWTTSERASYLAGIEYAYAVISQDIADLLDSYNLLDKQQHYHNHSEWDWKHGKDLLTTAEKCGHVSKEQFIQAQVDFLNMYEHMIVLTQTDIESMNKNAISFFFSREDSKIEINAFNQLTATKPNIFTICSGGEHIISYLQQSKNCQITAFDSNPSQLDVLKTKLKFISENKSDKLNEYLKTQGKFEQIFEYFRIFIGEGGDRLTNEYLKYGSQQVFNDKVLSGVFGENAVKFSAGKSFISHFYNAIRFGAFDTNDITNNILYNDIHFNYELPLNTESKLTYVCDTLQSYTFDQKYDLIDLSNVGDWMSESEFIDILTKAKQALNPNGILIVRKLLGNYYLYKLLSNLGLRVSEHFDDTLFYTNTLIATYI